MDIKGKDIIINETLVRPGKRAIIMLPMPKLYDWTPLNMPVHVINGKNPGPVLCVIAAIHGDEVNGVEIVRRLLKRHILRKLTGTLIAVPIANVYGFLYHNRYLMDRRDLNRAFPGSTKGSLAARLANLITKEIISQATHIIDLHSGSNHRYNLPQVRANIDIEETKTLACAFNVPVILHAKFRDGSLRQAANDKGIPVLLYEAGEPLRFDELCIRTGINGILGVMQSLNMIADKKTKVSKVTSQFARSSYWIRAPHSGMLRPFKTLGKQVKKGDILGIIANPCSGNEEHKIYSPLDGIIIGKNNLPLIHEGAALFHVACFTDVENMDMIEKQIAYLQSSLTDEPEIEIDHMD